ncbi:hypothetical protein [Streptococcus ruminantium]|uniref:hypothetical protein n=1 Tax=Streptococcus ruminantium TaxID=1917441 RepID=UPI0012DEBFB1|nr:hypothetical protein [Streptococcus ruminantium]
MKFEASPIIFKTKVIEAFDANFSFSINLKKILKSYTFISRIDNLNLLFSSEEVVILDYLHKYFDFDSKLENFSQIHLFLFKKIDDLAQLKYDSLFTYKNSSVYVGKNTNENTVFLIDDCVYVEKDNAGSLTNIYYLYLDDLKYTYPIIIKIIESIITEYFLMNGFLPVHCSTGINCETNEVCLILGESRSGKTSYLIGNENLKLIGDEYCFFREDKIIPFDLYYKSYCWGDEDFDEDFDGFKRKIYKMSKISERQLKSINSIIYLKGTSSKNLQLVNDENNKISLLMEYLSNFPGKIYLNNVKKHFPLVISTTKEFLKIPLYLK